MIQGKHSAMLAEMRLTMANALFLTTLSVLASTFFGHALLDSLRSLSVQCFRISVTTQKELLTTGYGILIAIASLPPLVDYTSPNSPLLPAPSHLPPFLAPPLASAPSGLAWLVNVSQLAI